MTSRLPPQCLSCAHWISPLESDGSTQTCAAFPDEIPESIWWNQADHRDPYEGDHGIRWEPLVGDLDFPEWAMQ